MKIAIITGANRGIGKALALGFAKEKFKTILIVRKKSLVYNLSKEIEQLSGMEPDVYQIDLNNLISLEKEMEIICDRYPQIDILVNNAGIFKSGSLNASVSEYQKVLNINLSAPYVILKSIVKKMKIRRKGYIFNISSIAGKIGYSDYGVYSSSKFALSGLSESLYNELMSYGIKVTSLCPSYVNTDMARQAGGDFPGEYMIQTEDIMESIKYIMKLSRYAVVKEIVIDCSEDQE